MRTIAPFYLLYYYFDAVALRAHELPYSNRIKLFFQINKNQANLFFVINTSTVRLVMHHILFFCYIRIKV